MQREPIHRPPSYYIKKRLFANKPAVIGMIVIFIAHFVAIMGYYIMPDDTPFANDGSVQIQKQPPVFYAKILKFRKNMSSEEHSIFNKMFSGEESDYTIVPIAKEPIIKNDSVYFEQFPGKEKVVISELLVNIVYPLHVGPTTRLGLDNKMNYIMTEDSVFFVDVFENVQRVSKAEMEKNFWNNNLEDRTYLLGTDKSGRDILSRLLFGTRISLSIGFLAVLVSLIVGVSFGAVAGFFGGRIDSVIMWVMTVVWSIPGIMLVIAISLALQSKGVWVAFLAVGLTMWVDIARVVRGQIMGIKQKLYVEAARALGYSDRRIIFRHILPNIIGPLIVICTSNFASAILIEAGLSFLGLGVQPPTPSWGIMINEGFQSLGARNSWHLVLFPSVCISVMVLAFNLFGNGLRDAFDPQTLNKK